MEGTAWNPILNLAVGYCACILEEEDENEEESVMMIVSVHVLLNGHVATLEHLLQDWHIICSECAISRNELAG